MFDSNEPKPKPKTERRSSSGCHFTQQCVSTPESFLFGFGRRLFFHGDYFHHVDRNVDRHDGHRRQVHPVDAIRLDHRLRSKTPKCWRIIGRHQLVRRGHRTRSTQTVNLLLIFDWLTVWFSFDRPWHFCYWHTKNLSTRSNFFDIFNRKTNELLIQYRLEATAMVENFSSRKIEDTVLASPEIVSSQKEEPTALSPGVAYNPRAFTTTKTSIAFVTTYQFVPTSITSTLSLGASTGLLCLPSGFSICA